jgi:uroporphyrinogen-III synthase
MTPYALITRPFADAQLTAVSLTAMGIDSFIEPLLTIRPINTILPQNYYGLIVTSSNAVRSLSNVDKSKPLIAIGENTAETARQHGFTNVKNAHADVDNLIKYITHKYQPNIGKFIYAAGEITKGNLEQQLSAQGFSIEKIEVYQAIAAKKLSRACIEKFQQQKFGTVLLYSARTAEIFYNLITASKLENILSSTQAFCLSENVAKPIRSLQWKNIHIAKQPSNEYILELIEKFGFI